MTIDLVPAGAIWHLSDIDRWMTGLPVTAASAIANSLRMAAPRRSQSALRRRRGLLRAGRSRQPRRWDFLHRRRLGLTFGYLVRWVSRVHPLLCAGFSLAGQYQPATSSKKGLG